MKYRWLRTILDSEVRRSLIWNLKKVWYEHSYSEELADFARFAQASRNNTAIDLKADELKEAAGKAQYFLGGEITRIKTFYLFVNGED